MGTTGAGLHRGPRAIHNQSARKPILNAHAVRIHRRVRLHGGAHQFLGSNPRSHAAQVAARHLVNKLLEVLVTAFDPRLRLQTLLHFGWPLRRPSNACGCLLIHDGCPALLDPGDIPLEALALRVRNGNSNGGHPLCHSLPK